MAIGVLASTQERARHIIETDPLLVDKVGSELVPLSPRSQGHRGRQFEAIFVDSGLWPLSEDLVEELGPCLYSSGGSFYCKGLALPAGVGVGEHKEEEP